MNAVTGRWWLAAHVAPSRPDAEAEVAIQRELDAVEVQRTSEANAFVRRLASVAPYALLVKFYQELEQIMARELSARRRASELNRAARALGKAAGDFVADLCRSSRDDFDPASKQNQELQQAIIEESERAEFRLLVAVGQLEQGLFATAENTVTIDTDAVAALGDAASRVQSMVEVMGLLRSGVVVAQRLMSRQLLIYRERIEGASLYLRRLAAEIPDGAPTLVWSDRLDPEHGEMGQEQMRFDPLALDKALYLHRALRQAHTLLEATKSGLPHETYDGTRSQVSESDADPAQDDLTATTQAAAGAQPPTASDAVAGSPPGDREDQVVDLRVLVRHTTAFTDELERAWSAALDSVLLVEAQQEMGARYASLLGTIARRAAAADRALSTAGVDPGLPAHPLQPDQLARLTFDPEPKQRWRQRQLAEIDALTTLLEALKGIRAPSAQVVHVDQQRVESWWEAGAFAFIRDCVDLLLRVSEQVERGSSALLPVFDPRGVPNRVCFDGVVTGSETEHTSQHGLRAFG